MRASGSGDSHRDHLRTLRLCHDLCRRIAKIVPRIAANAEDSSKGSLINYCDEAGLPIAERRPFAQDQAAPHAKLSAGIGNCNDLVNQRAHSGLSKLVPQVQRYCKAADAAKNDLCCFLTRNSTEGKRYSDNHRYQHGT